jgi:hypothetical protein
MTFWDQDVSFLSGSTSLHSLQTFQDSVNYGSRISSTQSLGLRPGFQPHFYDPYPSRAAIDTLSDIQSTSSGQEALPTKLRKKKAPTLRRQDWEPVRARILELHDKEKKTVAQLRSIIDAEFGFKAEYV